MLTSKQRAFLRSEASKADALFQIGKGGVGDTVMQSVDQALDARELIKLSVLDNSDEDPREAAENMARETGAEVVSVIGRVCLYVDRIQRTMPVHVRDQRRRLQTRRSNS